MESIARKIVLFILTTCFTFCLLGCRVRGSSIVTTAKTIHGDVYNCVDIYKQPSLRHPALRHPEVKKRVHKYLGETVAKMQSKIIELDSFIKEFWLDEGCPIGTVPIPQMTRKQLKLAKSASNAFFNHSLQRENPTEFAGIVVNGRPGTDSRAYTGAAAAISIYNPQVSDEMGGFSRYSTASFILESGSNPTDQLQVGWMVKPSLFGDSKTRMYIAWLANDDQNNLCINFVCQGFIQVSSQIPLGFVLPSISIPGQVQFDTNFDVILKPDGWEFYFGAKPKLVGYFPGYLFTKLTESAERVRFGGLVYSRVADEYTPEMGSGQFKPWLFDQTCYMRSVLVRDMADAWVQPTNAFVSNSRCYRAGSNQSLKDPAWQYRFMFGGAGGTEDTCTG